ncbi:MAG: AAA family ATPase, partial [Leptospira sp.]|nr:AAA family ATPase [Leptospira sp.]
MISKKELANPCVQELITAGKLGNLCIEASPDLRKAMEELPPGSLIHEGDLLYFDKTWQAKKDLEEGFRKLFTYTHSYHKKITDPHSNPFHHLYSEDTIRTIIEEIEEDWNQNPKNFHQTSTGKKFALNTKQKQAIISAVHSPFHIITGGPGTGKTTVVAFLMEVLNRIRDDEGRSGLPDIEDIALAAPTGRAGQRLTESIQANWKSMVSRINRRGEINGTTIHRLLKFQHFNHKYYYNKDRSFLYQFILVDEVSMVDLFLFQSLIQALPNPEDISERLPFRLILLGDPNQLPSVEKGAVFRDILEALEEKSKDDPKLGSILITKLEDSNRHSSAQGKKILALANSILSTETLPGNSNTSELAEFWIEFARENKALDQSSD